MHDDHFSINNIPYGIATDAHHPNPTVVTRFYDTVIFLEDLASGGLLSSITVEAQNTLRGQTLNSFAALPKSQQLLARSSIQNVLSRGLLSTLPATATTPISKATSHLPIAVGDFTDFSCSYNHVLNASQAVFNTREAPPGFLHFPVGYTARASSIVVSGTPIVRPRGQFRGADGGVEFGPTRKLDYELEVAAVIGKGNKLGESIRIEDADEHIFGVVLLNDWSARDIQALEMTPLGPLGGKSFCTSISPWIITLEALSAFRAVAPARNPDVVVASYLQDSEPRSSYAFDLTAELNPAGADYFPTVICKTQFSSLYWTLRHLVVHQTVNGCNLRTGDLLATGTVSGTSKESHGCLLELASQGGVDIELGRGEWRKRIWLMDGDELSISAFAGEGVGFGECVGKILPCI